MYSNNQEIEYNKLSDPLTGFSDDCKVGAKFISKTIIQNYNVCLLKVTFIVFVHGHSGQCTKKMVAGTFTHKLYS